MAEEVRAWKGSNGVLYATKAECDRGEIMALIGKFAGAGDARVCNSWSGAVQALAHNWPAFMAAVREFEGRT